MSNGFYVSRLRAIGKNVNPAEVAFTPGCNVLAGVSDTGKSYVLQCINYMLGGQRAPKSVEQDAGYETLLLEIKTWSGDAYVLQRSLKQGGNFRRYEMTLDDWSTESPFTTVKWKHQPGKDDTISYFLLGLSGLADTVIRTSKGGKTRPISFRDVCRFSLIGETLIIDPRPPVLASGQQQKTTEDTSIFNFFVSGEDASSVVPPIDIKSEKAKWRAQKELLESLIEELKAELSSIDDSLADQIEKVESEIQSKAAEIELRTTKIEKLSEKRGQTWRAISRAMGRVKQIDQLVQRFDLLEKHYRSDLERMKFVAEGDFLLSQLGEVHCPMCGQLLNEHDAERLREEQKRGVSIQRATKSESEKIEKNLSELESTVAGLQQEASQLQQQMRADELAIAEWDREISQALQPEININSEELNKLVSARSALLINTEKQERLSELQRRLENLGPEPKKKKQEEDQAATVAETKGRRGFCDAIESRLRSWKYKDVGTVEFDKEQDLVVNGVARRTHGKGVGAILQSAFTITLMTYCRDRHPGLVVLDSPLTSFRPADNYEAEQDVQRGLYEELCEMGKQQQVIIIENKEPDPDIRRRVNYIHFSGDPEKGRVGFYPVIPESQVVVKQ